MQRIRRTGAVAFEVINSTTVVIARLIDCDACAQPSRQPVMQYVFEKLLTTISRSLSSEMRANEGARGVS